MTRFISRAVAVFLALFIMAFFVTPTTALAGGHENVALAGVDVTNKSSDPDWFESARASANTQSHNVQKEVTPDRWQSLDNERNQYTTLGEWERGPIEDGDSFIFFDFDALVDYFFAWMPGFDNPFK